MKTLEVRPLRCPITRAAVAVHRSRQNDERRLIGDVPLCRVIHVKYLVGERERRREREGGENEKGRVREKERMKRREREEKSMQLRPNVRKIERENKEKSA